MTFPSSPAKSLHRMRKWRVSSLWNFSTNFPILVPDTPQGDSRSRLYSSRNDEDSHMIDTTVCTASMTHTEYNRGLVRSDNKARETSCSIQSLGTNFPCRVHTIVDQPDLLCNANP